MESDKEKTKSADDLVEKWIQGFHRGSLRFFILHLLRHERQQKLKLKRAERPFRRRIHGYHVAKAIKELTEERWEPKTASIYPILKQFKEEGIIEEIADQNDKEGKRDIRKYQLTDYGVEVAQKLEQARKDFVKAFKLHPRHGPPPRSHLQMIKSKLKLSNEEISELLKNASIEELENEKEQLKENIVLIQDTLKDVEAEIRLRKAS